MDKEFPTKISQILQDININLQGSQLCGAFQSEFGNANATAIIWQHQSFDFTKNVREEWKEKGENPLEYFPVNELFNINSFIDGLYTLIIACFTGSHIIKDILSWETKALIPFKISPMQ